jgi:hypothetical protein
MSARSARPSLRRQLDAGDKDQYGLADGDLALVIVVRHGSAPFAFSEALWTKYGKILAANMSANDPVAHPIPTTNVHAARLQGLAKQGMRLAVCDLSTRRYAAAIAKETGRTRTRSTKSRRVRRPRRSAAGVVTSRAPRSARRPVSIG